MATISVWPRSQWCKLGINGLMSTKQLKKIGNGQQKIILACDDWHLLCMGMNDRTASSRQLTAPWSTATSVLMSTLSIYTHLLHHGQHARVPLQKIPLRANRQWLCLQWACKHKAWQADWHQVSFQMNHASICVTMMTMRPSDVRYRTT